MVSEDFDKEFLREYITAGGVNPEDAHDFLTDSGRDIFGFF